MKNIKSIDVTTKNFRKQLNEINEELVKIILIEKYSRGKNLEQETRHYRENIFWYISAMQDITRFDNICPKIEQEIRDYRLFVKAQKKCLQLKSQKTR